MRGSSGIIHSRIGNRCAYVQGTITLKCPAFELFAFEPSAAVIFVLQRESLTVLSR